MDLTLGLIADTSRFHTGMAGAEHDVERFAGTATTESNKGTSALGNMFGSAMEFAKAVPGIGQLAGALGGLATGLVSGNAQFETFQTQFGVMLKGTDDLSVGMVRAKDRIGELSKFAATTPFELPQVVGAGKVLQAFGLQGEQSMKRFGLSTTDVMTVVGDAAAGSGADFEELANTFGKLASGSTGDAIARLQELGIVTKEQLAQEGIAFSKSGEVMSSTDDLFKTVVTHIKGHMGGMMDAQSQTFEGMLSNLSDWKDSAIRTVSAPIFDSLKTNLGSALAFINSPEVMNTITAFAGFLGQGISGALGLIGSVASTVGPPLIAILKDGIGGAFTVLSSIIQTVTPWVQGFFSFLGAAVSGDGASFSAFVTGLPAPLLFIGQEIGDLVTAFMGFFNTLQSGGDIGSAFGTLLSDVFTAITSAAGSMIDWVANTGLPLLVSQLGQWANAFVSWIAPLIPPMLGELATMLGNLVGWLVGTALPAIIGKLAEWGGAFVAWIGPQIPPMLAQLGVLAGQLWDWMTGTALPNIMQKLGQWGAEFVAWIGPQIMPMLGALAGLLAQLAGWLVGTALPTIIGKLLEWGVALVAWIAPRIPEIIGALGGLLVSLGGWLIGTALPAIIQQLAQWGQAFLDWIGTSVLPNIGNELGKIALALYGWITQTRDAILGKAGEIGANLVAGIRDGVAGAWQGFLNWVASLAAGLPEPIKAALGIHSPADETQPVGAYFVEGLQVGAESAVPALLGTLQGIAQSMIDWGANLLATAQAIFAPMPDVFTGAANAIYAAWLPTFGPGGTIDLLMFAHDESAFFARLDATTNSRMDGYAITWSNKLIILDQRITDGLTAIRDTAVNAGVGIAQGLGEGFTGAIEDVGRAMANAAIAAVNSAIDAAANAVGGANIPGSSAASNGTGPNSMMHAPGSAAAPTMASARPVVQVFIDNGNGYEPADASNVRYVLQEAQYQVTAASRAGVGSFGGSRL